MRDSRSSTVSHLVVSGVTGSMPWVLKVLVAIGNKWLLEIFFSFFFLERGGLDPAGIEFFCPKSPPGDAGPHPSPCAVGQGRAGKARGINFWIAKSLKAEPRAPQRICTALNTPGRLGEWTPRVYNCTPVIERPWGWFCSGTEAILH